jgi:predicted PurR-regulated permease PerM
VAIVLSDRSRASVNKVIVPAGLVFSNFMVGVVVVAILYFTREILVPIALAVLLSFVLAPLVRFLQRLRLPRSIAVVAAVAAALGVALSLATMVMIQVNQLASDLPRYESTLSEKIHNLRDAVGRVGVLKNASTVLKGLDEELKAQDNGEVSVSKPSLSGRPVGKTPIPVEVHQPDPAASETLVAILRPLVAPFTTSAIIVVFLIFFLFQREDLRNRFIRLVGSDDLERTTAALDDAGQRLSKLFLTQLILKRGIWRRYWNGFGDHRSAQFTTVGTVGNDPEVRALCRRDLGGRSSHCARGSGRQRLDHGDLDGCFVRRGRARSRPDC